MQNTPGMLTAVTRCTQQSKSTQSAQSGVMVKSSVLTMKMKNSVTCQTIQWLKVSADMPQLHNTYCLCFQQVECYSGFVVKQQIVCFWVFSYDALFISVYSKKLNQSRINGEHLAGLHFLGRGNSDFRFFVKNILF